MLQIVYRLTVQSCLDAFLLALFASFIDVGENLDGIFIDAQNNHIQQYTFVEKICGSVKLSF